MSGFGGRIDMQHRGSHLYWPVLGVVVAGAIGFYWWSAEQKRQITAAERAISVLPPGVEEEWEAYVKRRLEKVIVLDRSQLRLTPILAKELGTYKVVSFTMPYSVDCNNYLGSTVEFGFGEDAISVPIYGVGAWDDADPPPALGVDELSVAAKQLRLSLCEIVVDYMRSVTEP